MKRTRFTGRTATWSRRPSSYRLPIHEAPLPGGAARQAHVAFRIARYARMT
jgi:hypothetical protein